MADAILAIDRQAPLQVAILSNDSARRARLVARVAELGHSVCGLDRADIALVDGDIALPGIPAIVLGGSDTDSAGLISADAGTDQIDAALRAVAAGLLVRPLRRAEAAFTQLEETESRALLTPRELEILVALSDGLSNKAVARKLDISQHTVKFHVESVFRKLGVTTRAEAVARGLRQRLVHL